ncbi:hypothetical protein ABZ807_10895 [Micromonospora sp. NPDC047548]|uniref:hypothetical protein n=1 Tax=Micromonospora sp. NPDC047548 TaxID=3155624 RepID=UPI0033CEE5ED
MTATRAASGGATTRTWSVGVRVPLSAWIRQPIGRWSAPSAGNSSRRSIHQPVRSSPCMAYAMTPPPVGCTVSSAMA